MPIWRKAEGLTAVGGSPSEGVATGSNPVAGEDKLARRHRGHMLTPMLHFKGAQSASGPLTTAEIPPANLLVDR